MSGTTSLAEAGTPEEKPWIFPRPEYDERVAAALQSAREWYGDALPRRVTGYEFVEFAARSWDLVRRITNRGIIQVNKSLPSAATDGTTIWLPGIYFTDKFYHERADLLDPYDQVSAAVMCVNGSQIHEALHCLLTECNLPKWAATNPKSDAYFKSHIGFGMVLNLVEDIFIESYSYREYEFLTMFLHGKNDVLLGAIPLWESFNNLYQPDATQDDLIAALACVKNVAHRDDERWDPWRPIVDKLLTASDPGLMQSQRLLIAIELWEMITSAENAEGMPLPAGNSSIGIDSSSGTVGGALSPEQIEQLLEKLLKLAEAGELGEGVGGEKPGEGEGMVITIDASALGSSGLKKLDRLLKIKVGHIDYTGDKDTPVDEAFSVVIENMIIHRGEGKVDLRGIPPVVLRNIIEATPSVDEVRLVREFKGLGNLLRYMRQEKHHPGAPRTSGSKLIKQRLHRIATDGKVMALNDSTHVTKGKPRVILLIDMSGSMRSSSLIDRVMNAAYSAYESLVECQVPVAVYGHTAFSRSSDYVPLVYAIAAYQMPLLQRGLTTTIDARKAFGRVTKVEHSQNFDGIAIETVAARFPEQPGTRVLVVLSDGQPYGGASYGGQRAMDHTAEVIRRTNRSGTSVLSLSLTSDVMEANDKLYGKGNLPAYGNLLDRSLRHLVQVIATGQPLT